ncbi:hypothetical protein GCWU000342_00422 [Shuttleworthella satelles DSM 14600]|uniref:Uncharacterized protein n=1 Tax=Shuttleworthella satelles DSM 14600 TaxID=626523 RepID=C4G8X4_9FIRM|nr:hypothetical protein GCWU000342_00422 [Shuttleworthia satelles DSM 14600]
MCPYVSSPCRSCLAFKTGMVLGTSYLYFQLFSAIIFIYRI